MEFVPQFLKAAPGEVVDRKSRDLVELQGHEQLLNFSHLLFRRHASNNMEAKVITLHLYLISVTVASNIQESPACQVQV